MMSSMQYDAFMKTVTFRLPGALIAELDREARTRRVSKSVVVRDRLRAGAPAADIREAKFDGIADLIGSVDRLPPGLSGERKAQLKATGYGRKRSR